MRCNNEELVMIKYISHFSALQIWNVPYLKNVFGEKYVKEREANLKLDITVSDRRARFSRDGCKIHSCCMELPRNAIVKRNGQLVASPELTFLQLSNELDLQQLIFLGLIMCSYKVGQSTTAITTKRKLEMLLQKTSKHRGNAKAVRALKHVEEGAASIQEMVAFMIITLPHILGGYGINGACFNREILLNKDSQKFLNQKRCYADIFFEEEKLDIEYDSQTHHNNPTAQGKDRKRASALESQGIDVISFTTIQLYEMDSCKKVVMNIAKRLGRRIQIRTNKFEPAHNRLKKFLS